MIISSKNYTEEVGFEVITAVVYEEFCLLGNNAMPRSACHPFRAGFLLDLFLDPEDGGDILLRNVS
jgi:hypothetical protein